MKTYHYKDIVMLIAAGMVLKHFRDNLEELSVLRSDWNQKYADDLDQRINEIWENHIREDYRSDLREATDRVMEVSEAARKDLYFFKVQVESDFDKEVAESILTNLGFSRYYRSARQNNQESLMGLLYAFQTGMTPELRILITGNGITEQTVDRIISYAEDFKQANQLQEHLKYNWYVPTREARKEMEEIYEEVIKICKIAAAYYSDNPPKKRLFIFSRLANSTNVPGTKEKETEEPPAE